VKILLDTQVFLWAITDDARLKASHRDLFLDGANELNLSLASVWEMLIKTGLGKLPLPLPAGEYIARQMEKNCLNPLTIRMSHLLELEKLPPIHRDPFDRLLVAQARAEKMPILSADPTLREYGVTIL
jgi:PIN domain nuclease of toxin-antitoxin system